MGGGGAGVVECNAIFCELNIHVVWFGCVWTDRRLVQPGTADTILAVRPSDLQRCAHLLKLPARVPAAERDLITSRN